MLQPKLSACPQSNCTQLQIDDATHLYNEVTNPGGWGEGAEPNQNTQNVTNATVSITIPNSSTPVIFDVTESVNNAAIDNFPLVLVDDSDLGVTTLPNGIYTLVYTVTGTIDDVSDTYISTKKVIITCSARCCVDKMIAQIPSKMLCDCCEIQGYLNDIQIAESILLGLQYGGECGILTVVNKELAMLDRICLGNGCSVCP